MLYEKYKRESLRTESLVNPSTNKPFSLPERMTHASMGLLTEVGELIDSYKKSTYYGKKLDKINIEEEIGDIFWYLSLWNHVCSSRLLLEMPYCIKAITNRNKIFGLLVDKSNNLFRLSIEQDSFEACDLCYSFIYHCLIRLIELEKLSPLEKILQTNIDKLYKRYPDIFSTSNAIDRDLEEERITLEKGLLK